jgi:hypothetical protein
MFGYSTAAAPYGLRILVRATVRPPIGHMNPVPPTPLQSPHPSPLTLHVSPLAFQLLQDNISQLSLEQGGTPHDDSNLLSIGFDPISPFLSEERHAVLWYWTLPPTSPTFFKHKTPASPRIEATLSIVGTATVSHRFSVAFRRVSRLLEERRSIGKMTGIGLGEGDLTRAFPRGGRLVEEVADLAC